MSDLRGVGRSVEELLARMEGAAGGSALSSIKEEVQAGDAGLAKKPVFSVKKEASPAGDEGFSGNLAYIIEERRLGGEGESEELSAESMSETETPDRYNDEDRKPDLYADEDRKPDSYADEDRRPDSCADEDRRPQRVFKSFEEELLFAKEKAFRLLGDMDRTKKELSERLTRVGVGEEAIRKTLEYLSGYGYVDDERYARHYYAHYCAGRGQRRIRMELLKKGIDKETVETVLSEADDTETENERERCLALARKRAAGQDLSDQRVRSRLLGYLARRGFREADIWAALRKLSQD